MYLWFPYDISPLWSFRGSPCRYDALTGYTVTLICQETKNSSQTGVFSSCTLSASVVRCADVSSWDWPKEVAVRA